MVSRFARTIDTIPHPLPRELPFPKGALVKKPSPRGACTFFCLSEKPIINSLPLGGEGGSAHAESDEGLTYPKDHLNKEYATLPRSSVNTQPHRIRYQKERLSPHPSPFGRHLPPEAPPLGECPKDKGGAASPEGKAFSISIPRYSDTEKGCAHPRGESFCLRKPANGCLSAQKNTHRKRCVSVDEKQG